MVHTIIYIQAPIYQLDLGTGIEHIFGASRWQLSYEVGMTKKLLHVERGCMHVSFAWGKMYGMLFCRIVAWASASIVPAAFSKDIVDVNYCTVAKDAHRWLWRCAAYDGVPGYAEWMIGPLACIEEVKKGSRTSM